jgi:hypothetical protein
MMEIGKMKATKTRRQSFIPAIKAITGAPIRYDREVPALIHPIAVALFSKGKYSPIRVIPIGTISANAIPAREKAKRIKIKFDANAQPKAEIIKISRPVKSNDLCLNLTLKAAVKKEKNIATVEIIVFI